MRSLIVLAALILALAGCAQDDPGVEDQVAYPSQEELVGGLPINDRGNVSFKTGDTVVSRNPNSAEPVMQYAVTGIEKFDCNDKYSSSGPRLRVNITAQTFADPDGLLGEKSFFSFWEIVSPSGYTQQVMPMHCGDASKTAPTDLKPSRSYQFAVVLEAPETVPDDALLVKYLSHDSVGAEWNINS